MAFEKLKRKLQESKLERAQISAAQKVIRKKAVVAALQEREKQSIRVAEEKEKLRGQRQIETAKAGGRASQIFKSIQARQVLVRKVPLRKAPIIKRAKRISTTTKKRAKRKSKSIKRKASRRAAPRQQTSPIYSTFDAANLVR